MISRSPFLLLPLCLFSIFSFSSGFAQTVVRDGIVAKKGYIFEENRNTNPISQALSKQEATNVLPVVKSDFLVNTDCGNYGADQAYISIARSNSGEYMCVWIDERTGLRQLDGQIFNENNESLTPVFHVSDQANWWNSQPHLVFNPVSQEFITTWAQFSSEIKMQRTSITGVKIGNNQIVSDLSIANSNNPSAAIDPNGNIFITWTSEGYFDDPHPAYFKIFDKNGKTKVSQKTAMTYPDNRISSFGWEPRIASDSTGKACIVWSGRRSGSTSRILLQTIDSSGSLVGPTVFITEPDTIDYTFPTIASLKDGHYLVLFESDERAWGRVYSTENGFSGPKFEIPLNGNNTYEDFSCSSDGSERFFVACSQWNATSPGAKGLIVSKAGVIVAEKDNLTNPSLKNTWGRPVISQSKNNSLFIAYYGYKRLDLNSYIQKFDTEFNSLLSPVKVVPVDCGATQMDPIVTFNSAGKSIIVWKEYNTGYPSVAARVYDENYQPVANPVLVSDTTLATLARNPSVIADKDGNFIISFLAGDYSESDIYAQKISQDGTRMGGNVKLSPDRFYYETPVQMLHQDATGSIYLFWYTPYYSPVIYMKKFNTALQTLAQKKAIFQFPSWKPRYIQNLSVSEKSELLVLWSGFDQSYYLPSLYLKAFVMDVSGKGLADTVTVDTDGVGRYYGNTVTAIDKDRNMLVLWYEGGILSGGSGLRVFRKYSGSAMTYEKSLYPPMQKPVLDVISFGDRQAGVAWHTGEAIEGLYFDDNKGRELPFWVQSFKNYERNWAETDPSFSGAVYGGKLLVSYAYSAPGSDRGYDIFARVMKYPPAEKDPGDLFPELEVLSEVFPNPASAGDISINLDMKVYATVEISLYNLIGQKVATIFKGDKEPGKHVIVVNTASLSSGIYFIRYEGFNSYSRKFIVVK